jgi:hypothetical protein
VLGLVQVSGPSVGDYLNPKACLSVSVRVLAACTVFGVLAGLSDAKGAAGSHACGQGSGQGLVSLLSCSTFVACAAVILSLYA